MTRYGRSPVGDGLFSAIGRIVVLAHLAALTG